MYQQLLDDLRDKHDVPGVSAVLVQGGEELFAGGSGVTDLQTNQAASADSVYYIGSMTKVLTAILTLQLSEQKKLDLDAAIEGIGSTSAARASQITIRHLLTHTSGLSREGDFSYWFSADFPSDTELAEYLARSPLTATQGRKVHYSNVGFAAIGAAISSATDTSFDSVLQRRVLEPLQMHSSGSPGPPKNVARGYSPRNNLLPDTAQPFAGVGSAVGDRRLREYHDAKAMTPAFGAYSTVRDLSKLAAFLLSDKESAVLSLNSRLSMRKRQVGGRGLGTGIERFENCTLLTHGGWFAAHRSQLLIDTSNSIAVVVIANSDNAVPRQIADALYKAALKQTGLACH